MNKITISGLLVAALGAFFLWGVGQKGLAERNKAQKECVEEKIVEVIKEKEVVKYVTKEKAEIWSAPNASRDELVGLYLADEF